MLQLFSAALDPQCWTLRKGDSGLIMRYLGRTRITPDRVQFADHPGAIP
jgi:hypothetical protein